MNHKTIPELEFLKHQLIGASSKQALASSCTWLNRLNVLPQAKPGLEVSKTKSLLQSSGKRPKAIVYNKLKIFMYIILYNYMICIAINYDSKQTSSKESKKMTSFYCQAHQVVTCPKATRSTVSRPETFVVLEPALDNTTGEVDLVMSKSNGQFDLKQT